MTTLNARLLFKGNAKVLSNMRTQVGPANNCPVIAGKTTQLERYVGKLCAERSIDAPPPIRDPNADAAYEALEEQLSQEGNILAPLYALAIELYITNASAEAKAAWTAFNSGNQYVRGTEPTPEQTSKLDTLWETLPAEIASPGRHKLRLYHQITTELDADRQAWMLAQLLGIRESEPGVRWLGGHKRMGFGEGTELPNAVERFQLHSHNPRQDAPKRQRESVAKVLTSPALSGAEIAEILKKTDVAAKPPIELAAAIRAPMPDGFKEMRAWYKAAAVLEANFEKRPASTMTIEDYIKDYGTNAPPETVAILRKIHSEESAGTAHEVGFLHDVVIQSREGTLAKFLAAVTAVTKQRTDDAKRLELPAAMLKRFFKLDGSAATHWDGTRHMWGGNARACRVQKLNQLIDTVNPAELTPAVCEEYLSSKTGISTAAPQGAFSACLSSNSRMAPKVDALINLGRHGSGRR